MSRILKNVHNSAKRLHETGHITDAAMREFDKLCAEEPQAITDNRHIADIMLVIFIGSAFSFVAFFSWIILYHLIKLS